MARIDALLAAVAAQKSVIESVEVLLKRVTADLIEARKSGGADSDKQIDAIIADIQSSTSGLANAVLEGTAADPEVPADPPADPPPTVDPVIPPTVEGSDPVMVTTTDVPDASTQAPETSTGGETASA